MNNFKRFNLETLQLATPDNQYSYRQLRYFINEAGWDEDKLNEARIKFLENDVRTQTKANGSLIIDDVGVRKYGKQTDGVYYQYYGAEGRNADCKVTVTSHYSDASKNFPIDIESYYKPEEGQPEESKISLACSLIDKAAKRNLRFNWVSFDRWYCTKPVVERVKSHDKYFVSKLKSNRTIVYQNQPMKVSELVKIAVASLKDQDNNNSLFDADVCHVKKLGQYRLIVKGKECFITNNLEVAVEEVVEQYGRRWAIDDFYKQAKDNLSFGEFQTRSGLSVTRHWLMVFLAFTFYVHCRLKGIFSKIYDGVINTLSEFTRTIQNLNIVRVAKEKSNVLLANFRLKALN